MFLIILSGRYPFFDPDDDANGITEIAHVFGLTKTREFAEYYGRQLYTNIPTIPNDELDLARLCTDLNPEQAAKWDQQEYILAVDLMKKCLSLIHTQRPTAIEALNHPFFK
jgi:cell division control protein 7